MILEESQAKCWRCSCMRLSAQSRYVKRSLEQVEMPKCCRCLSRSYKQCMDKRLCHTIPEILCRGHDEPSFLKGRDTKTLDPDACLFLVPCSMHICLICVYPIYKSCCCGHKCLQVCSCRWTANPALLQVTRISTPATAALLIPQIRLAQD